MVFFDGMSFKTFFFFFSKGKKQWSTVAKVSRKIPNSSTVPTVLWIQKRNMKTWSFSLFWNHKVFPGKRVVFL